MTRVPLGPSSSRREGFGGSAHQLQVLRNQSVGRTWSLEASGPWFATVMRMQRSSGAAFAKGRLRRLGPPAPGVAEPKRWEDVELGGFRAVVCDGDADAEVLGRCLRVLDEDIEVPIVSEHAGVEQLVLELRSRAALVGRHQIVVGVSALRILVEVLHVRMGWGAVEVEVVLLDVLAVVSLTVGEAEETLLENGIFFIPQSQGEAE